MNEGKEGGRKRERRKRNLKNINFLWVCFFFSPCLLVLEVCVVLFYLKA